MPKNPKNTTTIQKFIYGIIDYAGLFPPAKLNLKDALSNYVTYIKENKYDLLSSFVIPITQLDNVMPTLNNIGKEYKNIAYSFVATRASNTNDFIDTLKSDLEQINNFLNSNSNFSAKALELALPADLAFSNNQQIKKDIIYQAIELISDYNLPPFFEVPYAPDWELAVENLSSILSQNNNEKNYKFPSSFKIRCGGVKPEMTPPTDYIVSAIHSTAKHKISLKATAGLHHPFNHYNDSLGGIMHGFVNVFTAIILNHKYDINNKKLKTLIDDQNPDNFKWNNQSLSWNEFTVHTTEIENSKKIISSYGSCSFDEPLDDLKQLNLID